MNEEKKCTVIVNDSESVTISAEKYEDLCRRSAMLDMIIESTYLNYSWKTDDAVKVAKNILYGVEPENAEGAGDGA